MNLNHADVDAIFDGGHKHCSGESIKLAMCAACAMLVAKLLHDAAHEMERKSQPDLAYFLRAFEADVVTQAASQSSDIDAELAALTES